MPLKIWGKNQLASPESLPEIHMMQKFPKSNSFSEQFCV